jgi:hypothetical protein
MIHFSFSCEKNAMKFKHLLIFGLILLLVSCAGGQLHKAETAEGKITSYPAITEKDDNDVIPIVDVSDLSQAGTGTTKKITVSNLVGGKSDITGETYSGTHDFGGASIELPNGVSLPGSCTESQVYVNSDADSGRRLYVCENGVWVAQGASAVAHTHTFPDRLIYVFKSDTALGTSERLRIPNLPEATIIGWDIAATPSATCELDLWMDSSANHPPDASDSITGTAPPVLSAATRGESALLSGWTTSIPDGYDMIAAIVQNDSATEITLTLEIQRTVPTP